MFDIFGSLKALMKLESVAIDNNVFRLHYKVTVIILIAFSIIVNSRQYFGDPIDCTSDKESRHIMDNYCWIHSYVTVVENKEHELYPGVGPGWKHHYVHYYQWVGFVLFFQAMLFFMPKYLWKYCWEEGRITSLVVNMNSLTLNTDLQLTQSKLVVEYFKKNLGTHNGYAYKFFFAELLNFINIVVQILLTNRLFGYEFSRYGLDIMSFSEDLPANRRDPMNYIFPKVASCTFKRGADTGHQDGQPYHAICVLPVNIFNEKIYIFLWFWFLFLAVISAMALIYRTATILLPQFRIALLKRKSRAVEYSVMRQISIFTSKIGDWFLLYQVGKNMDPLVFGQLIENLASRLEDSKQKA